MFGREAYIDLITKMHESGLSFSTNWNKKLSKNDVLLRHDVDFSISMALNISKIEHSLKVKSTFFFLLSSNFYNLLSKVNVEKIHKIISLGHKVSLHWDPTVHENEKTFLTEKQTFEEILGVNVDIVSIHRPKKFLNNNNRDLFGTSHTYQNRFFRDMSYLSDSAGTPVQKKINNYLNNRNQFGLQLLLHPIWWEKKTENPTDTLNNWLLENTDFLKSEISLNCKTYKS